MRRVKHVLGIPEGRKKDSAGGKGDLSTDLAVKRTDLALDRSYLAAERTLMAWIRTALSMISFGFTIGKLGEALDKVSVELLFGRTAGIESVAYFLVVLGTVALIASAVQNRFQVLRLIEMGLKPQISLAFYIAVLLSLMGIFAFTAMVLNL
jgi:putative membrane protein